MSKNNSNEPVRDRTGWGIRLDGDFCRDRSLSAATRIILGQIRQYSAKPPFCIASNKTLAKDCGVSGNTVTTAIATLCERGLIKVEQGRGGRRTITAVVGSPKLLVGHGADEITNPGTLPPRDSGEAPKNCGTPTQKLGGDLKEELNKNLKEKKNTETASSFSRSDTVPETNKAVAGDAVVREWAAQAAAMMYGRQWDHRRQDGSTEPVQLDVPAAAGASAQELAELAAVAEQAWPGCDPGAGVRQVLRAAAWTGERRNKLQQYAGLYGSGCLGARAVLRIGGHGDPLAFARECAAGAPRPQAPAAAGTPDEALMMQRLAYSSTAAWDLECWEPCWREAAGRCRDYGALPVLYMACAVYHHESCRREAPLPWIACTLTPDDFLEFLPRYGRDRRNAWSGGSGRQCSNPKHVPQLYGRCVGCDIAQAAAMGRTDFRSRSCLLCAAEDIRITPELAACVSAWKGSAAELAARLEALAAATATDIPPRRGGACGVEDGPPSYIRCRHGLEGL